MRRVKLNQSGISLVELMLTLSIVSILAIVVMNFMVGWLEQYAISQTRAALLTNAQNAIDEMGDVIRLSSAADQNNRWPDANAPDNQFGWASDSSTLVLASAVEDTSGTVIFSDPSNYTSQKNNQIYFVENGVLYRRVLAAPDVADNKLTTSCPSVSVTPTCPADRKLTDNVTNFTVKYYNAENQEVVPTDARSIELSLTLEKKKFSQLIQSVYKTRMVFRND